MVVGGPPMRRRRSGPGRGAGAAGGGAGGTPSCSLVLGALRACVVELCGRRGLLQPGRLRRQHTPVATAVRRAMLHSSPPQGHLELAALRLHLDPARTFERSYRLLQKVGAGSFGAVWRVRSAAGGEDRAVKLIPKKQLKSDLQFVVTEIEAMLMLDHPNIVRFFEFFEGRRWVCIVVEFCGGGDFNELLRGSHQPAEVQALYRDVVLGVAYCHGLGVAHRDLKFENCLLCRGVRRQVAKVIDFGLSAIRPYSQRDDNWLSDQIGTRSFVAPEVLDDSPRYGLKCDLWSLGVMLYVLLTKAHPLATRASELASRNLRRSVSTAPLRFELLAGVDPAARELVEKLLVRDPAARISAAEALQEEWLWPPSCPESSFAAIVRRVEGRDVLHRLTTFVDLPQFAKVSLVMLAHHATMEQVEDMRAAFLSLDTRGDGTLSKEELASALASCGHRLREDMLDAAFRALDVGRSGRVSYVGWLGATLEPSVVAAEPAAAQLFGCFDADGDGQVTSQELASLLGEEEALRVCLSLAAHGRPAAGRRPLVLEDFRVLTAAVAERLRSSSRCAAEGAEDDRPQLLEGAGGDLPTLLRARLQPAKPPLPPAAAG